jgi:hypothetical protein
MRTFVTAMVALGTIAFPATAQTPKPSVGSDQVYWVATFTVDQLDKFKPIVNKIVAATEKEPGTLAYEYNVGDDQRHLRTVCQRARRRRPRHGDLCAEFFERVFGASQTHPRRGVHRRPHGRTEEDAR